MTDSQSNLCSRRNVLKTAGAVTAGLTSVATGRQPDQTRTAGPVVCLFSKPLQNRSFKELPPLLDELGIGAVDLTCRPGGHVLPERVTDDLPRAVELFKSHGIIVPMITTGILDAHKDHAEDIVRTASGLGIRYAKLGYYSYGDLHRIHERLAEVKRQLRDIVALFKQHGMHAGFHNHSGETVGAVMWDLWQLIGDLPPDVIGSYFDVRHATVEGGLAGWRIAMNLLISRITMVAVKDFLWQKDPKRGWRPENVPLGQGMTRFEEAFGRLKEVGFAGPISLHMEYGQHNPPVNSDEDKTNIDAIRKDHSYLTDLLRRSGLRAAGRRPTP